MTDLSHLPHEDWCDLGSTHADCCPSKAEFGCSCITREVVETLAATSPPPITAEDVQAADRAWGRLKPVEWYRWNADRGGQATFVAEYLNRRTGG